MRQTTSITGSAILRGGREPSEGTSRVRERVSQQRLVRSESKRRLFQVGFMLAFVAFNCVFVVAACGCFAWFGGWVSDVQHLILVESELCVAALGFIVIVSCSGGDEDLDTYADDHPRGSILVLICHVGASALLYGIVGHPFAPVLLSQLAYFRRWALTSALRPKFSSTMIAFLILLGFGFGALFIELGLRPERSIPLLGNSAARSCANKVGGTCMVAGAIALYLSWQRKRYIYERDGSSGVGWSPSAALFYITYYVFTMLWLVVAIVFYADRWYAEAIIPTCWLLGVGLQIIAGVRADEGLYECTVRTLPRYLERTYSEYDGAFMAEVLHMSTDIALGRTWWVHHGKDDAAYQPRDPRRNWHKGKIVSAGEAYFEVDVLGVRHHLPMASRGLDAGELLAEARGNLRCIDWINITLPLMQTSSVAGSVPGDMSISRPLRQDEELDFFLSHSWHDDAVEKFEKLTAFVGNFQRARGRDPTFWLDKVCIDQNHIADGLKVLPVNVMECTRMLVLCGPTYPTRLWCVWELCTLMSFLSVDETLERLEIVGMGTDPSVDGMALLEHFRVDNARCYDPNEDRKLRRAIRGVGEDIFEKRVRLLARQMPGRIASKGRFGMVHSIMEVMK